MLNPSWRRGAVRSQLADLMFGLYLKGAFGQEAVILQDF
jgi:hypothetical protein